MLVLFFGDVIAGITTVLVLGLLVFLSVTVARGHSITKWGRRILLAIIVGTALSALSATRDAFMMGNALFALTSVQSILCGIAGGVIYLMGFLALVVRGQGFRKAMFHSVAALLLLQILAVEGSRIAMLLGLSL